MISEYSVPCVYSDILMMKVKMNQRKNNVIGTDEHRTQQAVTYSDTLTILVSRNGYVQCSIRTVTHTHSTSFRRTSSHSHSHTHALVFSK